MFSKIVLSKENLISNAKSFMQKSEKDICVMVKANAYGHGLQKVCEALKDTVSFFGVSNEEEGEAVREVCQNPVIVFGACDDYFKCMQKNISFAVFSLKMVKKLIKLAKNNKLIPKIHICINTGMNRYGVKNINEFVKIIKLLQKNQIEAEGVYTHFSSLTTDNNYTQKQEKLFKEYLAFLPQNWKTISHVGGGNSIVHGIEADMYRVGLGIYGYGFDFVKPVLTIKSKIVDIVHVEKGEHVGYLCSFTANKNMTVATVPLGYGDGISRKLSNHIDVQINGKTASNVGNICMDAFMVDVTNIKCEIGDDVTVFKNASEWCGIIGTTEYEVLTNFSKFRGKREVE